MTLRALGLAAVTAALTLVAANSPAWASATLAASATPPAPGPISLTLATTVSAGAAAPDGQISSVAYTLPPELSATLSQYPACNPSTFLDPKSSEQLLDTGVHNPSTCPDAAAIIGSATADAYVPYLTSNVLAASGGEIVHTSGTYPLTVWLNFVSAKYGELNVAFGATLTQVGGQTVLTVDTDDAQGSALAYGYPTVIEPGVGVNNLNLTFSDTSAAAPVTAAACADGSWPFSETVTYVNGFDTNTKLYDLPAPPTDSALASVTCTPPSGGGSTGSNAGASTTTSTTTTRTTSSAGTGGVKGSTTPVAPLCVVPKVTRGAALASVKAKLIKAHCGVGRSIKERSTNVSRHGRIVTRGVPKGRVIELADKAGSRLKHNAHVNILVSSG